MPIPEIYEMTDSMHNSVTDLYESVCDDELEQAKQIAEQLKQKVQELIDRIG